LLKGKEYFSHDEQQKSLENQTHTHKYRKQKKNSFILPFSSSDELESESLDDAT
jgi:hypothetical protein